MPHTHFLINGERYTTEEAINIASEKGHLDHWLPSALRGMVQTREDGGRHLSPSSANDCVRKAVLKEREPYDLNPEKLWAAFVGNAVHNNFEEDDDSDELKELFLSTTLQVDIGDGIVVEVVLKGTIDRYNVTHKRITDIKTVSEFMKYNPVLKRGADRVAADTNHQLQLQLYKLLLEDNGYPVEEAFVWYVQTYKEARRNVFSLDLMETEDIREMATELAVEVAEYLYDGTIPEAFLPEHPLYVFCAYCPVLQQCQKLSYSNS